MPTPSASPEYDMAICKLGVESPPTKKHLQQLTLPLVTWGILWIRLTCLTVTAKRTGTQGQRVKPDHGHVCYWQGRRQGQGYG